jgi:hypothetical protein
MIDVKELCAKLAKYHWSPKHPRTYVLQNGRGLGRIAHQSYGAFNLTYAGYKLETAQDHSRAIDIFTQQVQECTEIIVHNQELGDWLTQLNAKEFAGWYKVNKDSIGGLSRYNIERALDALDNIQRI